jgi:phosphoglycolate phosphatase
VASTLFLWDIDGTLLRVKGAGRRAMNRAFQEMFGISGAFDDVHMAGGLDLHFIVAAFQKYRIAATRMQGFLEAYYRLLEQEIVTGKPELLPGVPDILTITEQKEHIYNALGTGNLERGARMKLEWFGLNRFFPVGGFCEAPVERFRVLEDAIQKAEAYYGIDFEPERVIVVGDTVKDIEAARQIGVRVAAVATGGSDYAELAAAEPDLLLRDLRDARPLLALAEG